MSTSDSIVVDILIVGAGPTGLFGAYYGGFRGLSVAVVDSLPEPGGQINAMYPEKQIFDIAGFPSVRGRELVDRLLQQAESSASPYDDVIVEYRDPLTSTSMLPTIGCYLQMIRSGVETLVHRQTSTAVYQVVRGSGTMSVGSEPRSQTVVNPHWVSMSCICISSGAPGALAAFFHIAWVKWT